MINYAEYLGFNSPNADRTSLFDSRGAQRTSSLFIEAIDAATTDRGNLVPIYTLRDRQIDERPSAYLIYMSSIDEYEAAMRLVGSMKHWRKLIECNWFLKGNLVKGYEGLLAWREDMAARDASLAKRSLLTLAKDGDGAAARKIFDMSTERIISSVGRPPTKAAKEKAEQDDKDKEQLSRIEQLHAKVVGNGGADTQA